MKENGKAALAQDGKLVVVLGMHRSGTSATTRALAALGADFGDRLLHPIAGVNEKGFFEDLDVLKINIDLLSAAGMDWHTVGEVELSRIDPAQLDGLQTQAIALLRAKCRGRTFALKDPRMSRLMAFWQPVFECVGVPVVYVVTVRNPISVASSLSKRDRFPEEKSHLLWLNHMVPVLLATRSSVRVIVDYDRLLDDPRGELKRMAAHLGMPLEAKRAEEFGREFLEEGLRHTRFQTQDLNQIRGAPHSLKKLFGALEELCRTDANDDTIDGPLELARQFLADLTPLLRYETRVQEHLATQAAAIAQGDKQLASLRSTLEEREQRVAELLKALGHGSKPQAGGAALTQPARSIPNIALAGETIRPLRQKPDGRTIFSFIVDADPKFAYEGYHLARSLIEHSCDNASDVNVQFTSNVVAETRELFGKLGCTLHEIERFGDGRFCNKIAQLTNLHAIDFAYVVLLDTDMIALADLRPYLSADALVAKVVDLPAPPVETLAEIARLAGMQTLPALMSSDAGGGMTYTGNCNGGFYGIPKRLAQQVDTGWRRWALWLLEHLEPLSRIGQQNHVDQVAMWLTIHMDAVPYQAAPSNVNYYVHFRGQHLHFDAKADIALLHYHDASLNVVGKLEPRAQLTDLERRAVAKANEQIGQGFENTTFWNLRYARFPERGSGVGSRGENIVYKRNLLVEQGIERAGSVLDVGCGDLEMIKDLAIQDYLGLDTSREALQMARRSRPDWEFVHIDGDAARSRISARQTVLCFEVLIHQPNAADYHKLIDFLAQSTKGTLIVSGYSSDYADRARNSMVHFYEPLEESLRKTGKFSSIRKIGAHSDVSVLRCDV